MCLFCIQCGQCGKEPSPEMKAYFNSPTRRCLSCGFTYDKREAACPSCGAKGPAPAGTASASSDS